jgi:hypothetical protein
MRKHLALVAITIISTINSTPAAAKAAAPSVLLTSTTAAKNPLEQLRQFSTESMHPELRAQFRTKKVASIRFWEAVAWCETQHDWENGGYYAGGMGIAQSAWRGFGGWQFATSPARATKEEQIIVANRISFLGFQTKNVFRTLDDRLNNRPFYRPAIGWRSSQNWGKNCVNWRTRQPLRDRYTQTPLNR